MILSWKKVVLQISFLIALSFAAETVNKGIVFKKCDRKIDLTSQLAKIKSKIIVENTGSAQVKDFLITLNEAEQSKLSYIAAQSGSTKLKLEKTSVSGHPGYSFYKVDLKEPLAAGKSSTPVEVEVVLAKSVVPFPTSISQGEKQLVVFENSHIITAAYQVTSQTTSVTLPSSGIESYTQRKPTSYHESTVTYGPYEHTPAFSADPMRVHYENNGPFLTVTRLERLLEVSHWGNIAIEETVDLFHSGAALKGSFSRYDYQRDHNGYAVVKSLHTVLPASAKDVYYRDDIGNISTSDLRVRDDFVELDLRPRFPLFGGWKTHYKLGYNVPSYEYLFYSGDQYALKMRFLDHIYDNMAIDEMVLKIILPEGVSDVQISTPFEVDRLPDSRHPTYLDTQGRLVIQVAAHHLTPLHIQDFVVSYRFPLFRMFVEPLLIFAAFLTLFTITMLWVRLDLTLSPDKVAEARMHVSSLCSQISTRQATRTGHYAAIVNEIGKQQGQGNPPKALAAFQASQQRLMTLVKEETKAIADLAAKMRQYDHTALHDRVSELTKSDKELQDVITAQANNLLKLMRGGSTKQAYADAEVAHTRQRQELTARCQKITQLL